MRLIDADTFVKAIENENSGMSISGAVEKLARTIQVNMRPTVNAIPVEWIKKQKVDFQNEDYPFNYCRGFQDGYNDCIDYLIDEWEEENGKSSISD